MKKAVILLPVLGIAGFGAYMLLKPKSGVTTASVPKNRTQALASLNQQYNQVEQQITSVEAQIKSGVGQRLQNVAANTKQYCEGKCTSSFLGGLTGGFACTGPCEHDHEKEFHDQAIAWGTSQTKKYLTPLLNQQNQIQQQITALTA